MGTKKDVNQIKDSISELTKVVHDISDDLISVKDKIILALRAENEKLTARIKSLDIANLQSAQYERRNNIIISGVPDTVANNEIEDFSILILKEVGVDVVSDDIGAAHRLRSQGNSTPIRGREGKLLIESTRLFNEFNRHKQYIFIIIESQSPMAIQKQLSVV